MSELTTSVLIPSFRRPGTLMNCLDGLEAQRLRPGEVIVVWQADDLATRDAATARAGRMPFPMRVLHSPEAGVVAAENTALSASTGEIVLLIDDDAIPPPDWVERHRAHYDDPTVGAVGGPAVNFRPDGTTLPRRAAEPTGRLTWFGQTVGNMHDHIPEWRTRPPREVDHLVGYNMSLRRAAFDRFEAGLKPYWQFFEGDACLQVKARGYRVLFDFANVVEHHPTNATYAHGREGDLRLKVYHGAYNQAFVLAKHTPAPLRPVRLLYLLGVGAVNMPGLLSFFVALRRHGHPRRELGILGRTWGYNLAGWRAGARARAAGRAAFRPPIQRASDPS